MSLTEKRKLVGIKRRGESPIDPILEIALAQSEGAFDQSDGAQGESSKNSPDKLTAEEGASADRSFSTVSRQFFDAMLGFSDMIHSTSMAQTVVRSVEMQFFWDKEVIPRAKTSPVKNGMWKIVEISEQSAPRISRQIKHLARKIDYAPSVNGIFLMGLVSQFDGYIGSLIRHLAKVKPNIVFESEKSYTAAEVLSCGNLDEFRDSVVEKEIEAVLRSSHEDQFKWLEGKIRKPLRENLTSWPLFIEICERRNLFAHTSGAVSATYLKKCAQVGHETNSVLGERLEASARYLEGSSEILLEIGVKLAQVIWRVSQDDAAAHAAADADLNEMAYELLYHQRPMVAVKLLEFGLSKPMKHPKKSLLHMMTINCANAYKMAGEDAKARALIESEDWAPFQPHFQICAAAVLDDLDAIKSKIDQVTSDQMAPSDFIEWPVFFNLVKSEDYLTFLKSKFGDDVISRSLETPRATNEDVADENAALPEPRDHKSVH